MGSFLEAIMGFALAGHSLPPLLPGRGLLDTGTDVCAITAGGIQRLNLPRHSTSSTQTAAGPVGVDLYRISLLLHGPAGPTGPLLVDSDLLVTGLTHDLSDRIDIFIGHNFLAACLLIIDWPARAFTLAY